MTCKLDPFFLFFVSWRCWTKHGTASRFAVNTQRWIHNFHAHSAGSCFTWTHKLQDASRNPQAKWLPVYLFRNLKLPREVLVQLLHRSAASSSFRMTDCWKINGCPWHPVWMTSWMERGPNFKVHDPSVCARQCSWKMQSIRTCKQQASWPLYFEMSISSNI